MISGWGLAGTCPARPLTTMTENIQIMTVDIAPTPPDYTADGLMDIVVSRAESMMDMLHRHLNILVPSEPIDNCKWFGIKYGNCPHNMTPIEPWCDGTCERYEPVDSGGGRERG